MQVVNVLMISSSLQFFNASIQQLENISTLTRFGEVFCGLTKIKQKPFEKSYQSVKHGDSSVLLV